MVASQACSAVGAPTGTESLRYSALGSACAAVPGAQKPCENTLLLEPALAEAAWWLRGSISIGAVARNTVSSLSSAQNAQHGSLEQQYIPEHWWNGTMIQAPENILVINGQLQCDPCPQAGKPQHIAPNQTALQPKEEAFKCTVAPSITF